ncbi:hypothetical protein [Bacillus dakarensis]|uniref:hypothetical protein n=1 Tax=Robertmurraya dakarensis TaxID=1926278 RepID=UPI0009809E12|nr:hypothetical protein [Bacillus dakarensis]
MNKYIGYLLILLISIFSYEQFNSLKDGLKINAVQEEAAAYTFFSEIGDSPIDDSKKHTFPGAWSSAFILLTLFIAIAYINGNLVYYRRIFRLLTPVYFQSNYVIVPSFDQRN